MSTYKLTYFNGRGGGEICRLTLKAAGLDFEDERLAGEEWQKRKPEMPMKALPALTIKSGDKERVYCQSGTISKYIARENGLAGSFKEEGLLVEEVYDSVGDTLRDIIKFLFEKDEVKKAETKKSVIEVAVPKFADYFNRRKKEYGQGGYIIGSELTLADLAVFNLVDGAMLRGYDEFWKDHESLLEHYNFIKKNPKISGWLEKRPKSEF